MPRSVRGISDRELDPGLAPNAGPWLEQFHERICGRVVGALVRRGWSSDAAWDAVGDLLVDILSGKLIPPGDGPLGAWVYVIVKRRLISAARRRVPVSLTTQVSDPEEEPIDALLQREQAEALHAAIETLSEKEHAALIGRFVDGLSYVELAKRLSVSEGAVRKRIYEARRKLERLL